MQEPQLHDRVMLIKTTDPWTELRPGDQGVVDFIDDTGTVFVRWDRGSRLGMIREAGDILEVISRGQ